MCDLSKRAGLPQVLMIDDLSPMIDSKRFEIAAAPRAEFDVCSHPGREFCSHHGLTIL